LHNSQNFQSSTLIDFSQCQPATVIYGSFIHHFRWARSRYNNESYYKYDNT
jgi:hypothetical protein